MPGITLEQAEAKLAGWMDADDKVQGGQSYSISSGGGSRTLTRANSSEINKQIIFWDKQVKRLSRGGIRMRGVSPIG